MIRNLTWIFLLSVGLLYDGTSSASLKENVSLAGIAPNDALADLLKGVFDMIKQTLIDAGLEPFPIPNISLNVSQSLLRGKLNLRDTNIAGVTGFDVTKIAANLITLSVDIGVSLPFLEISGDYDIDALVLGIVPVYGKGPFSIKVDNVEVGGGGKLKVALVGGYLSITNLAYSLGLGNLTVKFDGLLGGSELGELIVQIINDLGLEVFNRIEAVVHDIIVTVVTDVINTVLKEFTLADLIGGGKTTTTTTLPPPERSSS